MINTWLRQWPFEVFELTSSLAGSSVYGRVKCSNITTNTVWNVQTDSTTVSARCYGRVYMLLCNVQFEMLRVHFPIVQAPDSMFRNKISQVTNLMCSVDLAFVSNNDYIWYVATPFVVLWIKFFIVQVTGYLLRHIATPLTVLEFSSWPSQNHLKFEHLATSLTELTCSWICDSPSS